MIQPQKPATSPPSSSRASMITHRKRRTMNIHHHSSNCNTISTTTSLDNEDQGSNRTLQTFMEDVHIAAAVKLHNVGQSVADYYIRKVETISKRSDFDIPSHMLHEVTRGVEIKCSKEGIGSGRGDEGMTHYMSCSDDYLRRYQKKKAIMKRPPSLAPPDSAVYHARQKMKERQLETRTVIEQKINQVYSYLQNDPAHIKHIASKKSTLRHSTESYKLSLKIRLLASKFARQCLDHAVADEIEKYKERNKAMLRQQEMRQQASIVITKNWRRYVVLKERRRVLEEERLIEEAEQKIIREKERAFLEKMRIKMSLLQL